MVAISVLCAPVYCLGEMSLFGAPVNAGQAADAHGCCGSSEVPVDSHPANVPNQDESCQSCIFSAGMLDHKVLGGNPALLPPAADDLPLWWNAPVDVRSVHVREAVPVFKVPHDGPRYLAGGRAQQARLCVFLI